LEEEKEADDGEKIKTEAEELTSLSFSDDGHPELQEEEEKAEKELPDLIGGVLNPVDQPEELPDAIDTLLGETEERSDEVALPDVLGNVLSGSAEPEQEKVQHAGIGESFEQHEVMSDVVDENEANAQPSEEETPKESFEQHEVLGDVVDESEAPAQEKVPQSSKGESEEETPKAPLELPDILGGLMNGLTDSVAVESEAASDQTASEAVSAPLGEESVRDLENTEEKPEVVDAPTDTVDAPMNTEGENAPTDAPDALPDNQNGQSEAVDPPTGTLDADGITESQEAVDGSADNQKENTEEQTDSVEEKEKTEAVDGSVDNNEVQNAFNEEQPLPVDPSIPSTTLNIGNAFLNALTDDRVDHPP
jgi:hypothetical protein